jgi:hypothetical protein
MQTQFRLAKARQAIVQSGIYPRTGSIAFEEQDEASRATARKSAPQIMVNPIFMPPFLQLIVAAYSKSAEKITE